MMIVLLQAGWVPLTARHLDTMRYPSSKDGGIVKGFELFATQQVLNVTTIITTTTHYYGGGVGVGGDIVVIVIVEMVVVVDFLMYYCGVRAVAPAFHQVATTLE